MNRLINLRGVNAAWTCLLVSAAAWLMLAGVARATTVAAPTILGTPQVGQTLTVSNAAPAPAADTFTITDQWLVCTTLPPSCTNGPTGTSFPLTAAEAGATIEVTETATDTSALPSSPVTAHSTAGPTAAVAPPPPPPPPANTALPVITGSAQVGQILTLTRGIWTNTPTTITDQWESCLSGTCTLVGALNSLTYSVAQTDVGHTIQVVETASNGGTPAPPAATSAPTAAVLAAPTATAAPTISGRPQQGQTLTVTQGAWTNAPTSITDQWEDCLGAVCVPIPGQIGASYTLGPSDVGHTIQVLETAVNLAGSGPPAASAQIPTVSTTSSTSVATFPAAAPTATANQSVTLVATVVSASGNANPSGSVTILNGSAPIRGCTDLRVNGGQSGTVVCQTAFPAGTAGVSAAYVPGPGSLVAGSQSPTTAVIVGRGPTSISLAVTTKVARGRGATYTATVVLPTSNSGPAAPTGSMEFFDRGRVISACAHRELANLTATCTVKYRRPGTHHISALYTGDANFLSSSAAARWVKIVRTAPAVPGFVKSTLQWTFFYHPTYTQVMLLKGFGIANGTGVLLTCAGSGCPFDQLHIPDTAGGSVNLLPKFRGHHLRAGTRITVRLTHRDWVGKYYSFTMRAGRPPQIGISCLAVGRTAPGVGC